MSRILKVREAFVPVKDDEENIKRSIVAVSKRAFINCPEVLYQRLNDADSSWWM